MECDDFLKLFFTDDVIEKSKTISCEHYSPQDIQNCSISLFGLFSDYSKGALQNKFKKDHKEEVLVLYCFLLLNRITTGKFDFNSYSKNADQMQLDIVNWIFK